MTACPKCGKILELVGRAHPCVPAARKQSVNTPVAGHAGEKFTPKFTAAEAPVPNGSQRAGYMRAYMRRYRARYMGAVEFNGALGFGA
jgi:hypothetical protein